MMQEDKYSIPKREELIVYDCMYSGVLLAFNQVDKNGNLFLPESVIGYAVLDNRRVFIERTK